MARGGSKQRQLGVRHCLINGERVERSALIRFVLSPDGVVTPDILERLEGRGVWVSADGASLDKAIEKNHFSRGFKTQAKLPDNLRSLTESLLLDQLTALLGLARKAGEAICGTEKVAQALQNGKISILFQASDGSEREKRNLSYRNEVKTRFECLNRHELGMAFSRENVVNAALTGGGLSNRVKNEAMRLSLLRGIEPTQNG